MENIRLWRKRFYYLCLNGVTFFLPWGSSHTCSFTTCSRRWYSQGKNVTTWFSWVYMLAKIMAKFCWSESNKAYCGNLKTRWSIVAEDLMNCSPLGPVLDCNCPLVAHPELPGCSGSQAATRGFLEEGDECSLTPGQPRDQPIGILASAWLFCWRRSESLHVGFHVTKVDMVSPLPSYTLLPRIGAVLAAGSLTGWCHCIATSGWWVAGAAAVQAVLTAHGGCTLWHICDTSAGSMLILPALEGLGLSP